MNPDDHSLRNKTDDDKVEHTGEPSTIAAIRTSFITKSTLPPFIRWLARSGGYTQNPWWVPKTSPWQLLELIEPAALKLPVPRLPESLDFGSRERSKTPQLPAGGALIVEIRFPLRSGTFGASFFEFLCSVQPKKLRGREG